MNDDFYVGYLPEAPAATARVVRSVCAGLLLLAVVIAVSLAASQDRFPAARFEFGVLREFTGTISAAPVPSLLVARPGETDADRALSRYLLTVPGKHGAQDRIGTLEGASVSLRGSLIYRDGMTMIEMAEGALMSAGEEGAVPPSMVAYGPVTIVGEIVDGKCFLGIMNPGEGKPHRGCAARCISGGAPPMLVARDPAGDYRYLLLVGPGGEAVNHEVLAFVAEPVEITGNLVRSGDTWVLYAAPAAIRRVT